MLKMVPERLTYNQPVIPNGTAALSTFEVTNLADVAVTVKLHSTLKYVPCSANGCRYPLCTRACVACCGLQGGMKGGERSIMLTPVQQAKPRPDWLATNHPFTTTNVAFQVASPVPAREREPQLAARRDRGPCWRQ